MARSLGFYGDGVVFRVFPSGAHIAQPRRMLVRGIRKAETKGDRKQQAGRETEAERQRDRDREMRYRKTHAGTQSDGQS